MGVTLLHIALVAAGGALGGMARFWISGTVARRVGEIFPWGTFTVNVTGAFAIGMLAAWLLRGGHAPHEAGEAWVILAIGILGSYTTVSSFSLQTLNLARSAEWTRAALNIALSLALCLGAVAFGLLCGRLVFGG
jgi:fluoride exporter